MSTRLRRRLIKILVILPKFLVDWPLLRLGPRHFLLWFRLNWRFKRPGLFPNLTRPRGFNDKIQWLKLFDQSRLHVICSDKLAVRDYVTSRCPNARLAKVLWEGDRAEDIPWESLPPSCVIKTNHDSGSVWILTPQSPRTPLSLVPEVNAALKTKFGLSSLEWPYAHISPKVFVEEYLEADDQTELPDFKFNCSQGKVVFVEHIYGRSSGRPFEVILDASGRRTGEQLDSHFRPGEVQVDQQAFQAMKAVAEQLSSGWQYVRVDLYWVRNEVYFGEMTFFPMAGWYRGEGQMRLGELIELDLRNRTLPLSDGADWIA